MPALSEANIGTILNASWVEIDTQMDEITEDELSGRDTYERIETVWQALHLMEMLDLQDNAANDYLSSHQIEIFLHELIDLLGVYDSNSYENSTITRNSDQTFTLPS